MNRSSGIIVLLALIFSNSSYAAYVYCDGTVTGVLSGLAYCNGGQQVGFNWTGQTNSAYVCSSNKNMDALIITAYATGKKISVRDPNWGTCAPPTGSVPEHIWVQ